MNRHLHLASVFHARALVRGVAISGLLAALASSCALDADGPHGTLLDDFDSETGARGPCEDGATHSCSHELGTHNGVTSCFHGVQECVDGVWGPCEEADTESLGFKTLGAAEPCHTNPCDPHCQQFEGELPGDGWTAAGDAGTFGWNSGDPGSASQNVLDKVYNQPCATGADCQMNSFCFDPVSESCSHDICSTCGGLDAGCGTCATAICDAQPECCDKDAGAPSCSHSECTTGAALANGCSECASAVCAADASCCNAQWSSTCVSLAQSNPACGNVCAGSACSGQGCAHDVCTSGVALDAGCSSCVSDVCSIWPECCSSYWGGFCTFIAAFMPTCSLGTAGAGSQACSHDPCTTGSALTPGCGHYVSDVCASTPSCCDTSWTAACVNAFQNLTPGGCPSSWAGVWDQGCVDAVDSECGATCKAPPGGTGQCIAWQPGETNAKCNGFDLSVGFTCAGTVPICNHGTQVAPAGLKVIHVPENSGYFGDSAPPASILGAQTCTTQHAIPAGHCIELSCAGLTEGREIMVNPPNGNTAFQPECNHLDNWGVYVAGVCGKPTCASETIRANLKPVNMFISVDKSGSMAGTRWTSTKSAFNTFFASPAAADISVALEFFPASGCYANSNECGKPNNCSIPYVPLGKLATTSAPVDVQEAKLINAFNAFSPAGATPAILAFQGCHQWASAYTATHPDEQQICILVTDGEPNDCGSSHGPFVTAATNGLNNHGVLSYGIGIVGANQTLLNKIATAGGGQSFFVGTANLQQDLLNALLAIQGDAVGCSTELPAGQYDPNDALVTFTPSAGAVKHLTRVANLMDCVNAGPDGGWYLDNPSAPTNITLCPSTCAFAQADPNGQLDFTFPCQGLLQPTEYSERYEASCVAPQRMQWGYFGYDTSAPGNTEVVFEARWADTEAELDAASYLPLATARSTPSNTQKCTIAGGGNGCPIDLFTAAGMAPNAHKKWLELRAILEPAGGLGPTVHDYQLTYTCVDLE